MSLYDIRLYLDERGIRNSFVKAAGYYVAPRIPGDVRRMIIIANQVGFKFQNKRKHIDSTGWFGVTV